MGFSLKEFLDLFAPSTITPANPPAPVVNQEKDISSDLILPEEAKKLMASIENKQIKELADRVYLLAVNINSLVIAFRQQQEFLVQVATLHEELLHQLDQGKVVMIKRTNNPNHPGLISKHEEDRDEDEEEEDASEYEDPRGADKKLVGKNLRKKMLN